MLRIPPWVAPDSIELIGIARESAAFADGYVHVPQGAATNGRFAVRFPLSPSQLDLSFGGHILRARARGDQVVAMDNRGTECTFFDPYSA